MPLGQCEAAKIFWRTPELVEKLLPFLDLDSTLHLAQTHRVTKELLNKSFVWNKLIRRSCPSHDGKDFHDFTPSHDEKMSTVLRLVSILKLVKTPKVLVMDLLELICARFERIRHGGEVLVSCSSHPGHHQISWACFLLLEEIESAFGTTLQRLVSITLGGNIGGSGVLANNRFREKFKIENLSLHALSSRVSRQQQGERISLDLTSIRISSLRCAKAFFFLMQGHPEFSRPWSVHVYGSLGAKAWEWMATALQFQPGVVFQIETDKRDLRKGRRSDVKDIWDAIGPGGFYISYEFCIRKDHLGGAEGWKMVEQILDTPDEDDQDEEAEDQSEEDGDEEEDT